MQTYIIRPHLTEKSLVSAMRGGFTFVVQADRNKQEISTAIEQTYKVNVIDIHTANFKGKTKATGKNARKMKTNDWKKAIVRLKEGQTIEAFQISTGEPEKK